MLVPFVWSTDDVGVHVCSAGDTGYRLRLLTSCVLQSGTWAVIKALKSLPWLGTRRCNNSCAMTKSWKLESRSARSAAKVTTPFVEQEPHLRVMRRTRISLGRTLSRRAQHSTRSRMAAHRSSCVRIGARAQQDREDAVHDTAPFVPAQPQKRLIEGRPQPPLLIGVDRRVGEAAEKRIRLLREAQCRYASGIEARIVLQRPMDAERARRETACSRLLAGCLSV